MGEKYIRQNKNSFNIVRSSRTYAKITDLDDAIFIRDILIENDWNLDRIPQTVKKDDDYLVLVLIDDKIHLIAKYRQEPDGETVERLTRKFRRNPNNSRYGLNITRVFDTFTIKKRIAGDDYIFGYYDSLEDAQFVRNFLMDNQWDVSRFAEVEFDDETSTYKVIAVIDDNVYVVDSYASEDEIDLEKSYEKFLAKISKHRYGLASHPHLDLLKDRIPELEDRFNVRTRDENWSFDGIDDDRSVLGQVIFNLTPFEKAVFDSIDTDTSFEDIKKALTRYRSKNFDEKISKNLESLIDSGLVEKTGNGYSKTNF